MQPALYHDTLQDALSEVVTALGGAKKVGVILWPEKSADDAGRQLRHALDPDRPEKVSLEQLALLLRLGREKGAHAGMNYLARDAGYQDPVAVEPEDERAQLQRAWIESTKVQAKLLDRMERLMTLREVA